MTPPPPVGVVTATVGALRPYALQIGFALYIPLILLVDSRVTTLYEQYALGVLTFAVLWFATRLSPQEERRQVWLLVIVATGFEILGSLVWGLYRYRFGNVPLFVPPGHGLVYLFGLTSARTPLFRKHGAVVCRYALLLATAWAVAGLTVLPLITGRVDIEGAACLPIFAWFVLRSPRAGMFAAIFFATSMLEIFGTSFGNWRWAPVAPYVGVTAGNPPSVIAGGYCVIDGSVLVLVMALARLARILPSGGRGQRLGPAEVSAVNP